MVARGQGPRREPPAVSPEPGRQGDPPLPGVQATHRSSGPADTRAGALLSAPRRLSASRGFSLAALGLRAPKLGQRRPVAGVHGTPGRILHSGQAAGCGQGEPRSPDA